MTTKKLLLGLPIVCMIGLFFMPSDVYAHNGHLHGAGGTCDCNPPTLGVDQGGKRLVSGGIKINEHVSDVELFKQTLEKQTVSVGQPTEVSLKLYTEGGYQTLEHVELGIGSIERMVSGIMVSENPVSIEWKKTFDDIDTVIINDKNNLIKDVSVHVIDNSPTIGIQFKFTPTQKFDADTLVAKMWDAKKSSNMNFFYNALDIIAPVQEKTTTDKITSIESKIPQFKTSEKSNKIDEINQSIQCSVGKVTLLRTSNMLPVCVDAYQASVLLTHDWAIPIQ